MSSSLCFSSFRMQSTKISHHTHQGQFVLPICFTLPGGFSFPKMSIYRRKQCFVIACLQVLNHALPLSFKYIDYCKQCFFVVLLSYSRLGCLIPPGTLWDAGKENSLGKQVEHGSLGHCLSALRTNVCTFSVLLKWIWEAAFSIWRQVWMIRVKGRMSDAELGGINIWPHLKLTAGTSNTWLSEGSSISASP